MESVHTNFPQQNLKPMPEKVPLGVERHRQLKKKREIEHWQKMFDSLNNPEQISEARVIEERRKSREEKIKDTGII